MVKKEPVTIQRNTDVYPPFGTDKSVPYAHVGRHPIQHLAGFQFGNKLSETDKHKIFKLDRVFTKVSLHVKI